MNKKIVDIFSSAFSYRKLWIWMAKNDIRAKYRGSMLGPFWVIISLVILVSFLSYIYSQIFKVDIKIYVPYVAVGFISWYLIAGTIIECSKCFVDNSALIKNFSYPSHIYVLRVIAKNLIILKYNLLIYLLVAFIYETDIKIERLILFFPGLTLNLIILFEIGILLAIASARYRDIPHLIENVMNLAMFVTPVLFFADMIGGNRFIIDGNPFFHMIEVIRQPLLGGMINLNTWTYLVCMVIILFPISIYTFKLCRYKIAYWV